MRRRALLLGVAGSALLAALPRAGQAQLPLTGAGGGGPLSGPPFTPSAVIIHPEGYVSTAQLGTTDSAVGLLAIWIRGSVGAASVAQPQFQNWGWMNRDIVTNKGSVTSETVPGLNFSDDNSASHVGAVRLNFNDSTGGTNHSYQGIVASSYFEALNATWHHHIVAWDFTTVATPKLAYYVDGAKVTLSSVTEEGTVSSGFVVNVNSTGGFSIGGNGGNGGPSQFECAQYFLDVHTTGLISGSGTGSTLSAGTVAKFYNSGPVSYGANGSTPLGTQPEIYLLGPASSFLTNLGTATPSGGFTAANSAGSAATAKLYDTTWGPAGPSDLTRPYFDWVSTSTSNVSGGFTAANSNSLTNYGNPIALGDLILIGINGIESSTNVNRSIVTASGFTVVTGFPTNVNTGGFPFNVSYFYKIAAAGDVTAAGSLWTAPDITWTGAFTRAAFGMVMVFKNANATTPVQAASSVSNGSASLSPSAPTVTPTGAATLLLTLFAFYGGNAPLGTMCPSTQRLRYKSFTTFNCFIMASDESLTGTSATGTRTASATSSASPYVSVQLVLST